MQLPRRKYQNASVGNAVRDGRGRKARVPSLMDIQRDLADRRPDHSRPGLTRHYVHAGSIDRVRPT
jgi:hypothetical protein